MKLATWNINGLRARLDYVKLWLAAESPDIVGLQELKLTDDLFPRDEFEALGYHSIAHGQKAWNGVAILSKIEGHATHVGLPGGEELGARLLSAQINGVQFTTVYCPNGKSKEHEDFGRKLGWYDQLIELSADLVAQEKSILCGDFNIVPTSLDTWNEAKWDGKIFHTTEERDRIDKLKSQGWNDAFRALHGDEKSFSWWDYRGGSFYKKQGLRIDFVLSNAAMTEKLRSCEHQRDWRKKKDGLTASDHCPVVATYDI